MPEEEQWEEGEEDEEEYDEDDEDWEEPDGTPDELIEQGNALIKDGDLDGGVSCFSIALSKKQEEVGDEAAADLAPFHLAYADALLQVEEARSGVFAADPEGGDDAADDYDIAYECFECARIGFEKRKDLEGAADKDKAEAGKLLVFVHLRMGDLKMLGEDWEGAVEEFKESLKYTEMYDNSPDKIAEVLLPLAISYSTSGQPEKALPFMERAKKCVEDYLKKSLDDATKEKFTEIKTEIEEKIAQCKEDIETNKEPVPQAEAGASTTTGFAAPSKPEQEVVTMQPKKRKKTTEAEGEPAAKAAKEEPAAAGA